MQNDQDRERASPLFNEEAAYRYVEARAWPEGPVCPHCGQRGRSGRMAGRSTRIGTYKCYSCRKPFTVKVGTVLEGSHVPMHLWLQAVYLTRCGRRRVSPYQLHRVLGVTLKTASSLVRRIDEGQADDDDGMPMPAEAARRQKPDARRIGA